MSFSTVFTGLFCISAFIYSWEKERKNAVKHHLIVAGVTGSLVLYLDWQFGNVGKMWEFDRFCDTHPMQNQSALLLSSAPLSFMSLSKGLRLGLLLNLCFGETPEIAGGYVYLLSPDRPPIYLYLFKDTPLLHCMLIGVYTSQQNPANIFLQRYLDMYSNCHFKESLPHFLFCKACTGL